MSEYVIIMNGTNFPYYLCYDPDLRRMIDWTPNNESAYKYATKQLAEEDIRLHGLTDVRIEQV